MQNAVASTAYVSEGQPFISEVLAPKALALLTRKSVRQMKTVHSEKLIQSWLNYNHFLGLIELMEKEVSAASSNNLLRAKAYINDRKAKGEAAGLPDPDLAGVATSLMNLETQRENLKRTQTEMAFYQDVLEALDELVVGNGFFAKILSILSV